MNTNTSRSLIATAMIAVCLTSYNAQAESLEAEHSRSYLEDVWSQAYGDPQKKVSLYKNPDNPFIQEFNVKLRAQYQMGFVSANQPNQVGSGGHQEEWRRLRLGAGMKFFQHFSLSNVWNIGGVDGFGYSENGRWHSNKQTRGNLYEAEITYNTPWDASISVGKVLPMLLAENRTSSARYSLPEINALENQLVSDSSFGVWTMNDATKYDFGWYLGVWSNTQQHSRGTWGTWESAYANVGISYKVDKAILEEGRVYLDWIVNFDDMGELATKKHDGTYVGSNAQDIVGLYYIGRQGPVELTLEGVWGHDPLSYKSGGQVVNPSDVYGLMAMGTYKFNDHVQAVARYQWSKGNNAVKLSKRYTSLVQTSGSYVDEYQAIGGGFNFFLYKNDPYRAKIMTMVEYGNSHRKNAPGGFTGWTFVCGVYTNF